jgi:hypothetical protein
MALGIEEYIILKWFVVLVLMLDRVLIFLRLNFLMEEVGRYLELSLPPLESEALDQI